MDTTRPFGSIRQLPSGRYQARYLHLGRRITADTTFRTKADARAYLAGVEVDLKRGTHRDPKAADVRFDLYAWRWLDDRRVSAQAHPAGVRSSRLRFRTRET